MKFWISLKSTLQSSFLLLWIKKVKSLLLISAGISAEMLISIWKWCFGWEGACSFRGKLIWVVQRNQDWIVQELVGRPAPHVPPHPWSVGAFFGGWGQAEAALEPFWGRLDVWAGSGAQASACQDTPLHGEAWDHSCSLLCFLLVLSNVSDRLCVFRKEILHVWIPFGSAMGLGTEHFNTSLQPLWGHSGKVELEVKSLLYSNFNRQLQHK